MKSAWVRFVLLAVTQAILSPAWAHHSLSAVYDDKKTVSLKGSVIRYDWSNPHVFVYLDVAERGQTTTWPFEFDSRIELRRAGWSQTSLQVGDVVTIDGNPARDGSKHANGKSVTLANGKKLSTAQPPAQSNGLTGKPAPRWPDGRVRLGPAPGEVGYWANPSLPSLIENTAGNIRMNSEGLLANIADAAKVAPFQPWAKGLYEYRQRELLKDDPMAVCLPPGGPRQFQAPFGIRIVEQPDRRRIFVLSQGGNRNWRLINLDGRKLPNPDDASGTYFGYSSGKWDGDTLTIDTVGLAERFWFSNGGLPHTEHAKLTEHISRPNAGTLKYEVTVDDPGTYTRPWTGGWTLQWIASDDSEEYFCDDYNREELAKP
jgi:hypothetical protein